MSIRTKLIFKKSLKLRTNLQNRKRLLAFKFAKQKWKSFISYLKHVDKRRKSTYKIFDCSIYQIPRISKKFKKNYTTMLNNKRKTCLFFGGLKNKYLKKIVYKVKENRQKSLIGLLERRLDVILYRSHFVTSVQSAQQLIQHKHIRVNDIVVTNPSTLIYSKDKITISESIKFLIYYNLQNSSLWPIPPKYLIINYKIFEIIITTLLQQDNFSTLFPTFMPNTYQLLCFSKTTLLI